MGRTREDPIRRDLEIIFGKEKIDKIYKKLCTDRISSSTKEDLMYHGLSPRIAENIEAIFRIKYTNLQLPDRDQITEPQEVYNQLQELHRFDHERFYALFLNQNNRVISMECMSVGGINGTVVDTRLIFLRAIVNKSSSLVISHNHPSGNRTFSTADKEITKKIKLTGELLNIPLLDHILVARNNGYVSMGQEGILGQL